MIPRNTPLTLDTKRQASSAPILGPACVAEAHGVSAHPDNYAPVVTGASTDAVPTHEGMASDKHRGANPHRGHYGIVRPTLYCLRSTLSENRGGALVGQPTAPGKTP